MEEDVITKPLNSNVDSPSEKIDETNIVECAEEPETNLASGRITAAPGASVQFKKPLLVGPRKASNKFTKSRIINNHTLEATSDVVVENNDGSLVKQPVKISEKSPAEKVAENTIPIPYKEPKWSGLPNASYSFEVLKSGTILEIIDLSQKPYHVFGRLNNCDTIMAHPTVSRFHAVMQYRTEPDNENASGFYIYDLQSTHGTFLNKNRIRPHTYIRVQVGHMIKLGLSSRSFILQGPQEDEEPESELSVTELKELKVKEELAAMEEKQKLIMQEMEEEILKKKKEEEEGIDWGLGEDADETTDLSENPFAVPQNEQLYINDPKKTLRGWFEREGYDLEYNCQEKSFGHFICKIELPVNNSKGESIVAEASVRGKKKEAVVQCALEACRILDQYGLLRQANHESKKRKAKNWEDNDYYDSDDDTFLDRTGTVEKKRQLRMKQAGVKTQKEVLTYESLVRQHEEIIQEIQKIEKLIKESGRIKEEKKVEDENEDELDVYMCNLSKAASEKGKPNITKLKVQLASLRQEESNLRNLANIAKPAELPQLKPFNYSHLSNPVQKSIINPIFGKKKVARKPLKVFQKAEVVKGPDNDNEEEMDSD